MSEPQIVPPSDSRPIVPDPTVPGAIQMPYPLPRKRAIEPPSNSEDDPHGTEWSRRVWATHRASRNEPPIICDRYDWCDLNRGHVGPCLDDYGQDLTDRPSKIEPPFNSRWMVALGCAVVLANLLAAYASVTLGSWGMLPVNALGAGIGVWVTVTWVQRDRRRHAE